MFVSLQFIGGRGGSLKYVCLAKKQRFKCWSDQFITNVNKGDEERGGRTLLRIGVMGKGRRVIEKIERSKNCVKRG